ncbi:MAG: hypothetical protein IPK13_01695 [Deltaproteobacteria bacterium]|nr:hypothetical protein [Deltaproteobacteria bacterium]
MSKTTGRAQRAWLPWATWVALVLTGVYGTLFWIFRDVGPKVSAISEAARRLRVEHQAGDAIFLVPEYATRAREFLGDLQPLAVRDPLADDLETYRRVWVFGSFGEAEALRARFRTAGLEMNTESSFTVEDVTVDLYRVVSGAAEVYNFRDRIAQASVFHEKGGERVACAQRLGPAGNGPRDGLRWVCPYDRDWFYVGPEWQRMGDRLRLCLWAHPPREGRLLIRFPNVPLSGQIYGRAGHTLMAAVYGRAPVELDVEIDGLPSQRFEISSGDADRPFMMRTPMSGSSTVTFGISTPNNGANHFCFEASMRGVAVRR